jgi:hypothetical protein
MGLRPDEESWNAFSLSSGGSSFHSSELRQIYAKLMSKAESADHTAILLWSGVSLVDHRRFLSLTPEILRTLGGPQPLWMDKDPDNDDAQWVHGFVVNAIVRWQGLGLHPTVPNSEWHRQMTQQLLSEQRDDTSAKNGTPE